MLAGELHPFLVHFAVGLLLTAPAADVLGLLFRREALLRLHGRLGWVTLAAWVAVAAWRVSSRLALPLRARTLYLAAAFTAATVLAAETILGAALVYRHGVGLSPAARAEPVVRPTPR